MSAEDHDRPVTARPQIPDGRHPPAGISLYAPFAVRSKRQSFAYLAIERMRVPRRATKFYYRILVCVLDRGWPDQFEKKKKNKKNRNAEDERRSRRVWDHYDPRICLEVAEVAMV